MSDSATKNDLSEIGKHLEGKIDKAVDDLSAIIQTFMYQVDERFNKLEERQDALDLKIDKLINTIDGFVARIDRYEIEMAARDNQFQKLLEWARKVSDKTGIPLDNL